MVLKDQTTSKLQNELIENANKKLKDEIIDFKKRVNYGTGKFE